MNCMIGKEKEKDKDKNYEKPLQMEMQYFITLYHRYSIIFHIINFLYSKIFHFNSISLENVLNCNRK